MIWLTQNLKILKLSKFSSRAARRQATNYLAVCSTLVSIYLVSFPKHTFKVKKVGKTINSSLKASARVKDLNQAMETL